MRADVHGDGRAPDGVLVADVRDRAAVDAALCGVDAVVPSRRDGSDSASTCRTLPDYADSNVHGTAVLLAAMAAARVQRLVLASSMVIYGEGVGRCGVHGDVRPGPRDETDLRARRFEPPCPHCGTALGPALVGEDAPPDPRNAYAASKLAQEHFAPSWARTDRRKRRRAALPQRLRHRACRATRPTPAWPRSSCRRWRRGDAPRVFEDGGQRRDFVHVRDVAAATVAALEQHDGAPIALNVGSGTARTVGEMAEALATATGGPATAGHRRLPARRRPAHHRRLVAAAHGVRLAPSRRLRRRARGTVHESAARCGADRRTSPGARRCSTNTSAIAISPGCAARACSTRSPWCCSTARGGAAAALPCSSSASARCCSSSR